MYKSIHKVEVIDGDSEEGNSNSSWFAFVVFCNYNGKPHIELSCLTNSNPSVKKQLSRAVQREKAADKKKKEIEVTVVSENTKKEMLQQYRDDMEMCTLQQSFMLATHQLKVQFRLQVLCVHRVRRKTGT
eukprot:6161088-Ditylum_brightwellii.AAC.1